MAAPVGMQGDGASPSRRDTAASAGSEAQAGRTQPNLAAPSAGGDTSEQLDAQGSGEQGPPLILVGSIRPLLVGLALFALRIGARRPRDA